MYFLFCMLLTLLELFVKPAQTKCNKTDEKLFCFCFFVFVICSHCFIFTLSFKGSDIYAIVSKHTPQKNPKAVGTIPSHRVQTSQSIDTAPFSPQSVAYMDFSHVSLALQRGKAFKALGQCRPWRTSIGQSFDHIKGSLPNFLSV